MKILIVPDKFKGTLTASGAAQAIARGWCRVRSSDELTLLPMSDGGDGFGEVMSGLVNARTRRLRTVDAAHRLCKAPWWWDATNRTAIIESARIIGLAMLPYRKFHPFALDTFGLGAVFRAAARAGASRLIVGIGGSATNDGGFGLARALGWRFLTQKGRLCQQWNDLGQLHLIHPPRRSLRFNEVLVATDVTNPLLGPHGATRVYGPQKGLQARDFPRAEKCLRALAQTWKRYNSHDICRSLGTGAAGGLGFGLKAFLGARLERGFALFASYASLEKRLRSADLVITGEGSIDHSTFMGKGVGQIAARCRARRLPCIGLAGVLSGDHKVLTDARALTELAGAERARKHAAYYLEQLAAVVAREIGGRHRSKLALAVRRATV